MTTAGRHNGPTGRGERAVAITLGTVGGFDVAAATWLVIADGNALATMGVIAGSVLAVTTSLCLYYAEKVDPDV